MKQLVLFYVPKLFNEIPDRITNTKYPVLTNKTSEEIGFELQPLIEVVYDILGATTESQVGTKQELA